MYCNACRPPITGHRPLEMFEALHRSRHWSPAGEKYSLSAQSLNPGRGNLRRYSDHCEKHFIALQWSKCLVLAVLMVQRSMSYFQ